MAKPENPTLDVAAGRASGRMAILLTLANDLKPGEKLHARVTIPGIEGEVIINLLSSGALGVVVDSGLAKSGVTSRLWLDIHKVHGSDEHPEST